MSTTVEAPVQPPSYDLASQPASFAFNDVDDLVATDPIPDLPVYTTGQRPRVDPTYTRVMAQSPKEFYYELKKGGKSFAILTIIADGTYSKHMPTFVEGAPVKGRVRLILDKPDAIQSVVVNVSIVYLISRLLSPSSVCLYKTHHIDRIYFHRGCRF